MGESTHELDVYNCAMAEDFLELSFLPWVGCAERELSRGMSVLTVRADYHYFT